MCGIVAMRTVGGRPLDPALLRRASDALAHRGPDDEGFVLAGPSVEAVSLSGPATVLPGLRPVADARPEEGYAVGLANRRLAIIDLSAAGHGPMGSADGRVWLTYNGEVYNYRELAPELESAGYRFRSATDTEVVLAAYLVWGRMFLTRLNGMFALAVWDGRSDELLLARDRLGIKPLYRARIGDVVVAASEPKALLELGADRTLDPDAAYAYLVAGYADHSASTFFRGIDRVAPAALEIVDAGGRVREERYWSLDDSARFDGDGAAAALELRELFLDSVRLQLRSDVPVGTCLSGGVDSSAVAAAVAMQREAGEAQHAFTAAFPGDALDETRYAEAVASSFGLQHHRTTPTGDDLAVDLDALLVAQDEPFPSSSTYAQWRVMKLAAREGVTVLLDGQGGDELFAGYDGYRPALVADYLRRLRLGAAIREARAAGRAGGLAARTAVLLAPEAVRRRARERARAGTASFVAPSLGERRSALAEVERGSSLADLLRRALLSTVLPVLLRSEDRSSMAHSREARVPFLDHRLVELAFSLPTRLKVADGVTKRVFRDAVADLVPELVLERRDKVGFVTPEAEWLKRLPADTRAVSGDLVRREAVDELWRRLDAGDAGVAQRLWRVTCFERWRRVLGATLP